MIESHTWRRVVAFSAVLLLGAAGAVFAQAETGNLYGVTTDNEGARLPGVSVTLTGLGAPRTQVTDAQGNFRFLGLDPGTYALRAELEGFSTVEYPQIHIRVNRSTEVEVQVTPAVEEVITVTSESPLLDERKLTTGTSVSQIELEKIPTARDPWAILNQTPGVAVDRINVGGNESGQQAVFLGQGVSDDENDFLVDGVQITDMAAIGASPTYYDFDQFTEMQFSTGGSDVTKNTAGVSVNLVTKRGSNEFRGSARFYVTDGGGQLEIFDQADPEVDTAELGPGQTPADFTPNSINRIEDYGFEAGGPIVRDHAWLWGSWGTNDIKNLVPGAGPGGLIADDTILENTSMKLNAQLSAGNSAVASWNNGDKRKFGRSAGPTRPPETSWDQRGPSAIWKVEDTHVFSSNFFLTGSWSKVDGGFSLTTKAGAGPDAPRAWRDPDGVWQDNFQSGSSARPAEAYKADASYFFNTGEATGHEIRFGGRYREFETISPFIWPAGDVFSRTSGGQSQVIAHRGLTPPITQEYTSAWVQDTITSGRFTYNVGVRYDIQEGSNDPVLIEANPFFPETLPALDFGGEDTPFEWEDIQPRLGITYALGPERTTLLRASFSQFAEQLQTGDISHTNPAGDAYAYFENLSGSPPWEPGDRTEFLFPSGFDPADPDALISPNVTDPNLDAPITSELVLGAEHALMPEFVVGLTLTRRETDDFVEERDFIRGADGVVRAATVADYVPDEVLTGTLPNGQPYAVQTFALKPAFEFTGGTLRTNGDRSVEYNGIGLNFTKRLSNRWMLRGNVQWGEAEWDIGSQFLRFNDPNPAGGTDPDDTLTGSDIDGGLSGIVSGGSGDKGDVVLQSTWSGNVNGMYQIAPDRPWGFNIAANIGFREGYVLPYYFESEGADGRTRDIRLVDQIDDTRVDDIFVTDLRIDKELGATDDLSFTLGVDVFNVFNENYVMQRERNLALGNGDWLQETLSPRVYRLGIRLNWK